MFNVLPNGRQERFFDVFDAEWRLVSHDRNDVEPHRKVELELFDIRVGERYQGTYLAVGYGVFGMTVYFISSGLDFHDNQLIIFCRHDVEFVPSSSPVAVQDVIAPFGEVVCRFVYAFFSKLVVLCHLVLILTAKIHKLRRNFLDFYKKFFSSGYIPIRPSR